MGKLFALSGLSLVCAVACGGSEKSAPPTPGPSATLKLANSAKLGTYLVSGDGRALYYFAKDVPAGNGQPATSNCTDHCLGAWPLFHLDSVVVDGVSASDVGEITRSDGAKQTTYKGWPLYFFAGDTNPEDTNGEGADDIWFVLHAQPYTVQPMSKKGGPTLYLSDGAGRSLYYFFKDTVGTTSAPPVTACTSAGCKASWPLFLADPELVPSGLDPARLTVFTRADGNKQTAFDGHPLYYFAGDKVPGDTNGRGVNNAWDTIDPRAL